MNDNDTGFTIGSVKEDPQGHVWYQMLRLRGMLKLEMVGLKTRGRTAYSQLKDYGYTGGCKRVMEQLQADIDNRRYPSELGKIFGIQ